MSERNYISFCEYFPCKTDLTKSWLGFATSLIRYGRADNGTFASWKLSSACALTLYCACTPQNFRPCINSSFS